ncbi:hypothetical protein E2C01_030855 [Portunus trituberculatus]|uniref:Uncharacterized protein n=1 Tax=Portunus trituberculatus TaxID=210409 RepID=A0A5B7ERJ0_PORTR|nr:hypothetical protein [Portunus trituberculatus]
MEGRKGKYVGRRRENGANLRPKQEDINASVDTSVIHLVCRAEMKDGRVRRDGPHASSQLFLMVKKSSRHRAINSGVAGVRRGESIRHGGDGAGREGRGRARGFIVRETLMTEAADVWLWARRHYHGWETHVTWGRGEGGCRVMARRTVLRREA